MARPSMRAAAPTWVGVAIVAGVTMGGTGLHPRDVVAIAASSVRALAVVSAAWLLLSVAAVRAAFDAPGTTYLRALPGGPAWRTAAVALAAGLVHLPWLALWSAGGGAVAGAGAWLAMVAASLALAAAVGRLTRAPRAPRWSGALAALSGVHVRTLVRRRWSALVNGAGLAALGGALVGLMIGHESLDPRGAAVLGGTTASVAVAAALAAATTCVADSDLRLGWLTAASGQSAAVRRASVALVLAGLGGAAGLVATGAALAVAGAGPAEGAALAGAHVATGVGVGLCAVGAASWARVERDDRRVIDGGRVAIGLVLAAMVLAVVMGVFGLAGLGGVVAIGAAAATGGRPWT